LIRSHAVLVPTAALAVTTASAEMIAAALLVPRRAVQHAAVLAAPARMSVSAAPTAGVLTVETRSAAWRKCARNFRGHRLFKKVGQFLGRHRIAGA